MDSANFLTLIGFIGTLIAIMTPIIKLNSSITKLNTTIEIINEQQDENRLTLKDHDEKLNNHEIRIDRLERK